MEEFARYGVAGARVDRIAARARANKRLIYVYFGNKEQLFQAVVSRSAGLLTEAVPFTPDDLPGYAGALFDHLVSQPQLLRLAVWQRLERPEPAEAEVVSYRAQVDALATRDAPYPPADLLALVLGLAASWFTAPPALRALAPDGVGGADGAGCDGGPDGTWSDERLATYRAAVVRAVRGLLADGSG